MSVSSKRGISRWYHYSTMGELVLPTPKIVGKLPLLPVYEHHFYTFGKQIILCAPTSYTFMPQYDHVGARAVHTKSCRQTNLTLKSPLSTAFVRTARKQDISQWYHYSATGELVLPIPMTVGKLPNLPICPGLRLCEKCIRLTNIKVKNLWFKIGYMSQGDFADEGTVDLN